MMGDGPKTLLVVIVNYRTADLVIDCLRSLEPEVAAYPGARLIVVENASGDDSAERLASAIQTEGWSGWVSLVVAPRNGGFAVGNNLAIRPALGSSIPPDLVWLLNPDTIVRPGGLRELAAFFERRPDVGLAGSRLEYLDGEPQRSSFNFPTILGELESGLGFGPVSRILRRHVHAPPVPDGECQVDWVAGASLMVRREVFETIGLLDEEYFMYFEEVDFCRKAFRGGWPCWYVPGSRVVHLIGQSSGLVKRGERQKRRPRYWFDARHHYFVTNYGRAGTVVADALYTLAYGLYRIRLLIQRKPDFDPEWMLWDFFRYNFLPLKR